MKRLPIFFISNALFISFDHSVLKPARVSCVAYRFKNTYRQSSLRAARGCVELREALSVEHQRQARILGELALELPAGQHDAVRLVAARDHDLAGARTLGDERAVFLLQRDAHGVAGARHAHGFLQTALAGAIRPGEKCDGLRQLQVRGVDDAGRL